MIKYADNIIWMMILYNRNLNNKINIKKMIVKNYFQINLIHLKFQIKY